MLQFIAGKVCLSLNRFVSSVIMPKIALRKKRGRKEKRQQKFQGNELRKRQEKVKGKAAAITKKRPLGRTYSISKGDPSVGIRSNLVRADFITQPFAEIRFCAAMECGLFAVRVTHVLTTEFYKFTYL